MQDTCSRHGGDVLNVRYCVLVDSPFRVGFKCKCAYTIMVPRNNWCSCGAFLSDLPRRGKFFRNAAMSWRRRWRGGFSRGLSNSRVLLIARTKKLAGRKEGTARSYPPVKVRRTRERTMAIYIARKKKKRRATRTMTFIILRGRRHRSTMFLLGWEGDPPRRCWIRI